MNLQMNAPILALETGQVVTLDDAAGIRISTQCGVVWVTEEGDRDDHIVGPGETLVVERGGRTLVQALQTSRIQLQ
jgi:hypothetical protein